MAYKFKHIALGGTFDLFHKGHKKLIEAAFKKSKFITVGVTTDRYCQENKNETYMNFRQRMEEVKAFLRKKGFSKRAKVIQLNDIYGNTLSDKTIDGIIVTQETLKSATAINRERQKKKQQKLRLIISPLEKAEDGKVISSSRIRLGEIDTNGNNFEKLLIEISGRRLGEKIRRKLKTPFGSYTKIGPKINPQKAIAVGDVTTSLFLKEKITPKISVVDFLTNRQRTFPNLTALGFASNNPDIIIKNPPGTISKQTISTLKKTIKNPGQTIILVEGEEDLTAIPAILLAPLDWMVYYGQPKKGTVEVEITPQVKEKLSKMLTS